MAEEIITTTSEEGSGGDTPQTQVADPTLQDAGQGQNSGQGEPVDPQAPSASSAGKPERNNSYQAQNRIIEKTVKRLLSESLNPIIAKLENLNPPAPKTAAQEPVEFDYNDLRGSINRLLEQRLEQFEKIKLSGVTTELENNLTKREARNFLKSQPEIGDDQDKLDEIRDIMKNEGLDYMAMYEPMRAVKKAAEIWKSRRKNPNAPPKETLTTITGGAVNKGSKIPSVQELRDLQRIVTSDAPESEKEAAYAKIEAISKLPL